jgi:hypothetical protein
MRLTRFQLKKLIREVLHEQESGFYYGMAPTGDIGDQLNAYDKEAGPVSIRKGTSGWSVVQHKDDDSDDIASVLGSGYGSAQEAETMAQKIAHKMGANVD